MCTLTAQSNLSKPQKWINPFTTALQISIEPNCEFCEQLMDSWDMYFDHILFDQEHIINEYRVINERYNRIRHSPLLYKSAASRLNTSRNANCTPLMPLLVSIPKSPGNHL